eukprot:Gb_05850 [translate_table: standard]
MEYNGYNKQNETNETGTTGNIMSKAFDPQTLTYETCPHEIMTETYKIGGKNPCATTKAANRIAKLPFTNETTTRAVRSTTNRGKHRTIVGEGIVQMATNSEQMTEWEK